ncbi:MAG: sulfatase-like hydrolase/transferase [Candidatus Poribacteria bacterium]|nr:sulfatase-like hydrolase/transferase [Candidatus Poribacteria bacterium]
MAKKPNIIFIMPDQLRADFLSCYGATFIDTPHIDSIADSGVRYQNAYSASPVCVPARASLLTGLNAIKNGVTDNGQWLRPDLAACGIQTWPEMLSEQGYYTAAIGKMHFYPWDINLGFQYRVAAEDKRWLYVRDEYYHFLKAHGYRKLHGNEHPGYHENRGAIVNKIPWEYSVDHFVGEGACRFIRNYGDETPFAMMVGFPGPHCPYDPNLEFLEDFDPADMPDSIPEVEGDAPGIRRQNIEGNRGEWNGVNYTEFTEAHKKKIRAHYAALVKQIDYEVGQILDALREKKLMDNTIIVFSSDHGDYLGDHNLIGKGTFFESSIKVPLLVHLPGVEGSKTCGDLVELGDVTSTLLHFGGCEIPGHMDSIPLPELGIRRETHREHIIGLVSGGWMFYDGQWKLCKYATGEILLFDLSKDPDEQQNLMKDSRHWADYVKLDAKLSQEIMKSVSSSHYEKRVYTKTLSSDPAFGKEGWRRPYPKRLEDGQI